MTDHADIKASTDKAWLRAQLGEHMPDAEREAMHWLDTFLGPNNRRMADRIKSMLAAKPSFAQHDMPARLYEEDAVEIADVMRSDGWHMTATMVNTVLRYVRIHFSTPPKPPAPKTKTVFVVRASWSRPEARVKVIEWEGRGDAQMEASEQINAGAISVSITEEARPCS